MDGVLLVDNERQLLSKLKKQLAAGFVFTELGNVSRVLGINNSRGRKNGTITISPNNDTE